MKIYEVVFQTPGKQDGCPEKHFLPIHAANMKAAIFKAGRLSATHYDQAEFFLAKEISEKKLHANQSLGIAHRTGFHAQKGQENGTGKK